MSDNQPRRVPTVREFEDALASTGRTRKERQAFASRYHELMVDCGLLPTTEQLRAEAETAELLKALADGFAEALAAAGNPFARD